MRLRQVVREPCAGLSGEARGQDHGQRGVVGAQLAQELDPLTVGEQDVEDERVGLLRGEARPGEGEEIGTIPAGAERVPLPRYAVMPPMSGFEGDLEAAALYAGESVERIDAVVPAAELVTRLLDELRAAS